MNGPESHVPVWFYACAAVALIYFAYQLRRAFAVRIGQPEQRRLNPGAILRNALVYGIGQRKVASRQFGYATVMHLLLGWGFIELFFATTVD
ncbi:MAG: hypothetical protein V3W14_00060, partial [Candidatus Neomarinimicrobiota bacterium]